MPVFAARSAVIAVAWSSDYRVEGGGEELQHCRKKDNLVVQVDYPHCIGTNDKVSQTAFSLQKSLNDKTIKKILPETFLKT